MQTNLQNRKIHRFLNESMVARGGWGDGQLGSLEWTRAHFYI